jgi:FHS family L-fucose permease-like MFS transporter
MGTDTQTEIAMPPESQRSRADRALPAFALIIGLFLLWGIANSLNDILIPQFRKAFALSNLQSGLVQSAFYAGYFFLALPASLFMRRFGYKAAVVLGLILYGAGALLFYPAAGTREYAYFLGALFVIASGLAFLETSANPLVTVLGSPERAAQRLNFAQAFNPLGVLSGILIGRWFIFSGAGETPAQLAAMTPDALDQLHAAEAHAVVGPYMVIAAIVIAWAVLVLVTRFPAVAGTDTQSEGRYGDLLRHPHYLMGVVAQFFYVAAQVGCWSFMIRYAQQAVPGMGDRAAADVLFWSLVGFTVGRFMGTALMGGMSPIRLMAIFAAANTILTLVAATTGGWTGLLALAATSFFMSIMFPTIFASAIRGLGPLTKAGSSFLVMAIIGGAVFTPVMGHIADVSAIRDAMFVPAFCFAVVFAYAALSRSNAA